MKNKTIKLISTFLLLSNGILFAQTVKPATTKPTIKKQIEYPQTVDTIIKNIVYESYYSFKYKNPIYVKYKLYHGGGSCNRSQFTFKVDKVKNTASGNDYDHSGFDEGHLVPASDFAYDCERMRLTFKFYNCMPQTPKLNRGIWKSYETKIRVLSQTDSLLIICGGIYTDIKITNTQVYVPIYCWKIVKSLSTGKIIYALLFDNEFETSSVKIMPVEELIKKLGYNPLKEKTFSNNNPKNK